MSYMGYNTATRGECLVLEYSYPLNQNYGTLRGSSGVEVIPADAEGDAERNFTDYQLFSLQLYIQSYVGPGYQVKMIPYPFEHRNHICVELHQNGKISAMAPRLKQDLAALVETFDARYALLLKLEDLTYRDVFLPASWLQKVAPRLPGAILGVPSRIQGQVLYADLSAYPLYSEKYLQVLFRVLDYLVDLYVEGLVIVAGRGEVGWAKRWGLRARPELGEGAWAPRWRNIGVSGYLGTPFLEGLGSEGALDLEIEIHPTNVARHWVARALQAEGSDFYFYDSQVVIPGVRSYEEAVRYSDLVRGAMGRPGRVLLGESEGEAEGEIRYRDLARGWIVSREVETPSASGGGE